jgi:glutamate racemase
MPIGIFDSGLGGLTVLAALLDRLPEQDFVYLGDNANAPYGDKSPREVYDLTVAGVQRLFDRECKLVVLACNTASAVALHDLQVGWLDPAEHRVLGVFVPVIEHLTRRDWGDNSPPTHTGLRDVALFATPATVVSGAFPRELRFRARDVTVEAQPCPGLVQAIEAGEFDHASGLARALVADLLTRLPEPQSAVLGCTHYPLIEAAFRDALPAGTTLVSQPSLIADSLSAYLDRHRRFRGGTGGVSYLTTGEPALVGRCAQVFTGHPLPFRASR